MARFFCIFHALSFELTFFSTGGALQLLCLSSNYNNNNNNNQTEAVPRFSSGE